ncbi:MAG TPA: UDP-N-acetylglucosamine--N-acetylmuramyl-(pentapeptide) pyrophosphoryl-undecaprenol N-acetylglucosamine transferase, partial [Porticoccaceae bacterium]|nr:UDP-N-acetylglucosamine--N-acetylmuramyl-(pentapeptide) pyrophosphoryl-undecaprenol N-acetylglucosamine transferase [Porticoccaceae bacterium]
MEPRRVLIMAGGTGGHVFPGLAVAEVLRQRSIEVSWLGTRRGVEAELVPARNFPIFYIEVAGLRGKKGLAGKVKAPWLLLKALWQALGVLRRYRPNVVLGLGGFASGPGGLAARLLS